MTRLFYTTMDNQTKCTELASWKEIAGHLGITIRTAQIWERDRGLPVHRRLGKHGRVFAQIDEIDGWRQRVTSSTRDADAPPAESIGAVVRPVPVRDRAVATVRPRSRTYVALLLVPILVAVGVSAYRLRDGAQPARYRFVRNGFIILGQKGHELWRKDFPDPFPRSGNGESAPGREKLFLQDVDYDGETEVVVSMTGMRNNAPEGELVCFSASGLSKWTFRTREAMRSRYGKPGGGRGAVNIALADFGRPVGRAFVVVMNYPDDPQIALVSPQDGHLMRQTAGDAPNPAAPATIAPSQLDRFFE